MNDRSMCTATPVCVFGALCRSGPGDEPSTCKGAGKLLYCTGSFCDPVPSHATAQFTLWAVMGAPLLLSFDIRQLTKTEIHHLYGNPEIIAVNQDADHHGRGTAGGRRVSFGDLPWGSQAQDHGHGHTTGAAGSSVASPTSPPPTPGQSTLNIWARNLHDGSTAMLFLNSGPAGDGTTMVCDAACLHAAGLAVGKTYAVRDLVALADLAPVTLTAKGLRTPTEVAADAGTLFLKLTPQAARATN